MKYDPKLREAMEEVRAICKKYDCMGAVLLVSPSHTEFGNIINPTWSVMHWERQDQIRFRSKKEDFEARLCSGRRPMRKSPYNYITDIEWDQAYHAIIDDWHWRTGEDIYPDDQHVLEWVHLRRDLAKDDRFADDFDRGFKGMAREDG